jgi:hypothetical protein
MPDLSSLTGLFFRPSRGAESNLQRLPAAVPEPRGEAEAVRSSRIRLHHRVAGRVRLSIPRLRGNPTLAQRLVMVLEADAAIDSVRANSGCGSVVIQIRLETLPDQQLAAHLSSLLRPWLELPDLDPKPSPDLAWPPRRRRPWRSGGLPSGAIQASSISRRPPLTWPLADLSQQARCGDRAAVPQPTGSRQAARLKPKAPRIDRPEHVTSRRCWLCSLNQQFMQALLRWSLRCWWEDRRRGLSERFARLRRDGQHHRRPRLRPASLASQ